MSVERRSEEKNDILFVIISHADKGSDVVNCRGIENEEYDSDDFTRPICWRNRDFNVAV